MKKVIDSATLNLLIIGLVILSAPVSVVPAYSLESNLPPRVMDFRNLTVKDGLSNPVVMGIAQDNQGFMWFGTANGLNKYDGYKFTRYLLNPDNPNDPHTIGGGVVTELLVDSKGFIWIATYGGGLDRYDPRKNLFTHYKHNPDVSGGISHNIVSGLVEDAHGNIWASTVGGGLNRWDRKKDSFSSYRHKSGDPAGIADDKTYDLFIDSRGVLWVAVANGIDRFDRANNRFMHYRHSPHNPNSLTSSLRWHINEDRHGDMWFSSADGGGLVRYDRARDRFIRYSHDPENPFSISSNSLRSTFEDSKGTLWVATRNGLNVFDRENERFIRYYNEYNNPKSIAFNDVFRVYEDNSGVMWFSTFGGGISVYDRKKEKFHRIPIKVGGADGRIGHNIRSIIEDRQGCLWIGTSDGLIKYDPDKDLFTQLKKDTDNPNSLTSNHIWQIAEDGDGYLWIATGEAGINKYDPRTGDFTHFKNDPKNPESFPASESYSLHYHEAGDEIWIGSQSKIIKYEIQEDKFTSYDTTSFIMMIHEDQDGDLWFSGGAGLFKFDRRQDKISRFLNKPHPAMASDASGRLWIGGTTGLKMYDKESDQFVRYTIEDGLPDNYIVGILNDGIGGLWISTALGLSHFDIGKKKFKNYDVGSFNMGKAYCRSGSGYFYFGDSSGLIRFSNEKMEDNPHKPPIVLTSFRVFNKEVKFERAFSSIKQIDLSYKDNVISFEFAALDYSDPSNNLYKYKLEGFDKGWTTVSGARRWATYTNLDGGIYTFRVIGSNNDGIWNENGLSIKIKVKPPFWETWWFYYFMAIATLIIILIVIYYILKLRSEIAFRREAETALAASEEKYSIAFQSSPVSVVITDAESNQCLEVNETFLETIGYDREKIIGRSTAELGIWLDIKDRDALVDLIKSHGRVSNVEIEIYTRSGDALVMLVSGENINIGGRECYLTTSIDITARKQAEREKSLLESQLYQSQKMDAVGTLAGGIAHDFNNILQAISGNVQLISAMQNLEPKIFKHVSEIEDAINRAAELVKSLLTTSRKVEPEKKPLDLNIELRQVQRMLERTIPKMISIETIIPPDTKLIYADPNQFSQVMMNLGTNARDAMPEGGKLTIKTANVTIDEELRSSYMGVAAGKYVEISVSDTGHGMSQETLSKIFDPFFTTKDAGKGTGLGMAVVDGIVKNHSGCILCQSEPKKGAEFSIYWPAASDDLIEKEQEEVKGEMLHGGDELILVVDDEEAILEIAEELLTRYGYSVIKACNGEEALEIYAEKIGAIDLIIMDLSMPGIGGYKTITEILKIDPEARIMIASGYSANIQVRDALTAGAVGFVAKPYKLNDMLRKIREVLDKKVLNVQK